MEKGQINSLDFYKDGRYLVTSCEDNMLRVYDVMNGNEKQVLNSKKHGLDVVKFTHHEKNVICASKNEWDETIRYWSLYDNNYLRYFKGHRKGVVALCMSPSNDSFLSASLDQTVRLWDLRSASTQGLIRPILGDSPRIAFDYQKELIFAITTENKIKLFDFRKYDKGPFSTFEVNYPSAPFKWSSMEFSKDGKYLICSTDTSTIFVIDSFEGNIVNIFNDRENNSSQMINASCSPDSKFVFSGSENGKVYIWPIDQNYTHKPIAVFKEHSNVVKNVLFNPTNFMMASSCSSLAFWIPNYLEKK